MSENTTRARRTRTVLDPAEFRRSHLRDPRGRGSWMFRGEDGEVRTVWGTLTECRRELPGGTWVVLP